MNTFCLQMYGYLLKSRTFYIQSLRYFIDIRTFGDKMCSYLRDILAILDMSTYLNTTIIKSLHTTKPHTQSQMIHRDKLNDVDSLTYFEINEGKLEISTDITTFLKYLHLFDQNVDISTHYNRSCLMALVERMKDRIHIQELMNYSKQFTNKNTQRSI